MNIANEVRALIAATKECLGQRPCEFLLMTHKEGQVLTPEEAQIAQKNNTPILIKKHDGTFSLYGKLSGSSWRERSLNSLTGEQQNALLELDFAKGTLKFNGDFLQSQNIILILQKGHSATIYEQSLEDMFHNLVYEGIPKLKEEGVLYYPVYELYATEQDIPFEKKPGDIYLYIKDGQFHYQTQWVIENSEQEEQPPVYTGIIDMPAPSLKMLQDVEFVANSVKVGAAARTLWYDHSDDKCVYTLIADTGKKEAGVISIAPKCNLSLLTIAVDDSLSEESMESARQAKTPILIKKGHMFSIYGKVGGVWQERNLENLNQEEKVRLEAEIKFLEDLGCKDALVEAQEVKDSTTDILKKGHTEVGDTQQSIREKLLTEIQQKGYCLDKKKHLKKIQEKIEEAVKDAGHMQPFYEDRKALPQWYKEIRETIEVNFLISSEELYKLLCQENFVKLFADEEEQELIEKLKQNFSKVVSSQQKIVDCLQGYENPSQLIDCLKEAYGAEFSVTLYSEMTTLIAKFDSFLCQKYKQKISEFFVGNKDVKDQNKLLYFLVNTNLTARFSAQYVLRRQMLFNAFSSYFRKGHKKFDELAPMYSAINKSALAANKAKDGFADELVKKGEEGINRSGLTKLMSILNEEKDLLKKYMINLILPLWTFLVLDTQSASEKGSEKNDTAIFYLQRKILIEHLEKFKKEWTLSDEANTVASIALGKISASGYQVLDLELNDNGIAYAIRLVDNPETEIRGFIESKDLNELDIPKELDLKNASFTASILWAIARKGHIPAPRNEDITLLLEAVIQIIWVLSPKNCSPPENKQPLRRGRLLSALEPRPMVNDSGMYTPSPVKRGMQRNTSIFFRDSQKYPKPPIFSDTLDTQNSYSAVEEESFSLSSSATVDLGSSSSSPTTFDRSSSTSPLKRGGNSCSSSPVELAEIDPYFFSSSPQAVDNNSSPESEARSLSITPPVLEPSSSSSSSKVVDRGSSSDEESGSFSSTETKDSSSGKDKKALFREKVLIKRRNVFFEVEEINVEVMKKLCMEENDCNAFYFLACAARDGRYGVTKDRVAAFYLACLAEKNLPATAKEGTDGKFLVDKIIDELTDSQSVGKPCQKYFRDTLGFDPQEEFLRQCDTSLTTKLAGTTFPR